MHLAVDTIAALTTIHQADIRREVAGYHLARQVATAQRSLRMAVAEGQRSGGHARAAVRGRVFAAAPARWPRAWFRGLLGHFGG